MAVDVSHGTLKDLSEQDAHLVQAALEAREKAVASYSHFAVGAALEDGDGRIWTGCNVESSSFGLSMCAERVALFKAMSEGVRSFRRIAIVAGGPEVATPCGACRQVLNDHASGIDVVLYNPEQDEQIRTTLANLIPLPFDGGNLSGSDKA